jgi:hypothetical protein
MAAGGAPLDSAKIVSVADIKALFFVFAAHARHGGFCTRFNQLLKQLQSHLPHWRNLLAKFIRFVTFST